MCFRIEIPAYDTVVVDLRNPRADRLLQQYSACIFFVGEQFVNHLTVPFCLSGRGGDLLLGQTIRNLSKALSQLILLKNPSDYIRLIWIHSQRAIGAYVISIAFTPCKFRVTSLETLPDAGFN